MTATEARTTLLAQHEHLRRRLDACAGLAWQQRTGESTPSELDEALAQLRDEFADHNQIETTMIVDLLHGPAAWCWQLIDRMLEEHVAEHAAFWRLLSGTPAEVAKHIDELADELDAHLSAEERTFLNPMTLRDDLIRRRPCELATG
ncbi:MAG TPA: hemerythrin domain-containing protein [Kofleriaceae bacterium]|jgi:iron-sulfur cluster repair protein YtfE (RIC family)|nr:hemerythrin domain-containing protein [Kofleriaceae bacterium]